MRHFPFAYVGPGAGFAFLGSFLSLLLSLLASVASLLLWPFRMLWGMLRGSRAMRGARVKKAILLGLGGLDPGITEKLMAEGKLPNFARLKEQGSYKRLRTISPRLSTETWSSFATGAKTTGYADSEPFWKILGRHAVDTTIIRVPVKFSADGYDGRLIAGTQDLMGTEGHFSLFTRRAVHDSFKSGNRYPLVELDGVLHGELAGPGEGIPFQVREAEGDLHLEILGWAYPLKPHEYTQWIRLKFGTANGIVRFLVTRKGEDFSLYATPVQIDPEKPAQPISQPAYYAIYLAKLLGSFSTLEMAEDTGALKDGAIDEGDFLTQVKLIQDEREAMYFSALDHLRSGVVACVFDTPGRIRHVSGNVSGYSDAIERMYLDMDRLVGRTLEYAEERTAVFVLSDHGALFSNRKLDTEDPGMEDMAPTVLGLFGVQKPEWMEGKPVIHFA